MTERIALRDPDAAESIFLRALLANAKHIKPGTLLVDVELKVNGVEVPLKPTMEMFATGLEEVAKKQAEDMLSETALKPLADALREARVKVRRAISNL